MNEICRAMRSPETRTTRKHRFMYFYVKPVAWPNLCLTSNHSAKDAFSFFAVFYLLLGFMYELMNNHMQISTTHWWTKYPKSLSLSHLADHPASKGKQNLS